MLKKKKKHIHGYYKDRPSVHTFAINPAAPFLTMHKNIHTNLDAKVYVDFIDSSQNGYSQLYIY